MAIVLRWLSAFNTASECSVPEMTSCVISQQTECRNRHGVQLASMESYATEIWKAM